VNANWEWSRYEIPPARREKRDWSKARLAAAARAVRREQEAMPLFPELRQFDSVDERIEIVNEEEAGFRTRMRAVRADNWKRARSLRRSLPASTREGVRRIWNGGCQPRDPVYLLSMLREAKEGKCPWTILSERESLAAKGRAWRAKMGWVSTLDSTEVAA